MRTKLISSILVTVLTVSTFLSGCNVSVNTVPEAKAEGLLKVRAEDELGYGLSRITDHVHEIESKTFPLYVETTEDDPWSIELAFTDGAGQVPYITLSNAQDLFDKLIAKYYTLYKPEEYKLTSTVDGATVILTRPSGYFAEIDFDEDTIYFLDFDGFLRLSENAPLLDTITAEQFDDEGRPYLFQMSESSFERYGVPVTFRPGDYMI